MTVHLACHACIHSHHFLHVGVNKSYGMYFMDSPYKESVELQTPSSTRHKALSLRPLGRWMVDMIQAQLTHVSCYSRIWQTVP
jgi:hypothetical protein